MKCIINSKILQLLSVYFLKVSPDKAPIFTDEAETLKWAVLDQDIQKSRDMSSGVVSIVICNSSTITTQPEVRINTRVS